MDKIRKMLDQNQKVKPMESNFKPYEDQDNPVMGYLEGQLELRDMLSDAHTAEKRLDIFRKILK